jgi:deoxycytidylate deaminase
MRMRPADYLLEAYEEARQSDDPSTQNGAVVVSAAGLVIGRGRNRFARGLPCDHARLGDRDYKYPRSCHAEKAAIYDALRRGHADLLPGATLYCPWYACQGCSVDILEAGIRTVIGHAEHPGNLDPHSVWGELVEEGLRNLSEAGVLCGYHSAEIGAVPIRINYELWRP